MNLLSSKIILIYRRYNYENHSLFSANYTDRPNWISVSFYYIEANRSYYCYPTSYLQHHLCHFQGMEGSCVPKHFDILTSCANIYTPQWIRNATSLFARNFAPSPNFQLTSNIFTLTRLLMNCYLHESLQLVCLTRLCEQTLWLDVIASLIIPAHSWKSTPSLGTWSLHDACFNARMLAWYWPSRQRRMFVTAAWLPQSKHSLTSKRT